MPSATTNQVCPDCDRPLANVQGIATCPDCGTVVDAGPSNRTTTGR